MSLWRRSFLSDKHLLYPIAQDSDLDYFLNDAERMLRSGHIDDPFSAVLNDKLYFWSLLAQLTTRVAPVAALLANGRYHPLGQAQPQGEGPLWERLGQIEGRFIVKPQYGSGGVGLFRLERNAEVLLVDGKPCSPMELEARFDGRLDRTSFLLCPFIEQAGYSAQIHAASTNTVRVLTLFDDRTREVLVAGAVHRFGRAGVDSGADNLQRGGIAAYIEPKTGRLGHAIGLPYDGKRLEFVAHPDTGAPIKGVLVPRWTSILQELRHLASHLTFLPYIGWDVIVTEQDFVVLEGNYRPGVISLQAHRPLLADPLVMDWYRHKGVVRGGSEKLDRLVKWTFRATAA